MAETDDEILNSTEKQTNKQTGHPRLFGSLPNAVPEESKKLRHDPNG